MMSLWDALRMNMMISYQELVRTFLDIVILLIHSIIAEQKPRNKVADPARSIFPIRAVILNHKARYYKPIPG